MIVLERSKRHFSPCYYFFQPEESQNRSRVKSIFTSLISISFIFSLSNSVYAWDISVSHGVKINLGSYLSLTHSVNHRHGSRHNNNYSGNHISRSYNPSIRYSHMTIQPNYYNSPYQRNFANNHHHHRNCGHASHNRRNQNFSNSHAYNGLTCTQQQYQHQNSYGQIEYRIGQKCYDRNGYSTFNP